MQRLNLLLVAIASLFLYYMLRQVGWQNLENCFRQVGFYGLLLLIPYAFMNLLTAMAWKILLVSDHKPVSLYRLFLLRLGGESLNQLTPTASLGGEPFKALRLKAAGVPWQEATASLVIHKGLMVMSLVLYVLLSIAMAPFVTAVEGRRLIILALGAVALALGGIAFIVVQLRSPCLAGIRLLEKWGICPAVLKARKGELAILDTHMAEFYRSYPGRSAAAFAILFLSWVLQAAEVYLIFRLMGRPVSWEVAFCLDALAMVFVALGFIVPGQLGVQDGGNVLLSLGFKLGAVLGVAFSILRRIREVFWLLVGLLVVVREK